MTRQNATENGSKLLTATVPEGFAGHRVDQALAVLFDDYSRSRIQHWIRDGRALIDGKVPRPRDRLHGGELVELRAEGDEPGPWSAEDLPVNVVYADSDLLIVNKSAGCVVHPGAGNHTGTLVNALLHHDPQLATIPRAGIVHRLDKDTSGLMLVARTLKAHKALVAAIKSRQVERLYDAVVTGTLTAGGTIEAPVGRHRTQRTRMAVAASGKFAVSHYRIQQRYPAHTWIRVKLETGRTHQIRVHMAHIGHPLVGDPVYGKKKLPNLPDSPTLEAALHGFGRQALHAASLQLPHPCRDEELSVQAPLPSDMQALVNALHAAK